MDGLSWNTVRVWPEGHEMSYDFWEQSIGDMSLFSFWAEPDWIGPKNAYSL